jgi:hypothetical protein
VKNSFTKLRNALDLREKLLLRQIEVLLNYPENKVDFNDISFQINEEDKVLNLLRNYGVYSNIDCFLPYLENENEENENFLFEKNIPSVIDNKRLNSSIINLTLKESQNLITKSNDLVTSVSDKLKADLSKINNRQSVIVEEKEKEISPIDTKSIKQKNEVKAKQTADEIKIKRNDTTTSSKKKTLKNISNLTLNSCGGNIILKNISNLTINSCKSTTSSSQHSTKVENAEKSCSESKCEGNYYQCDFYERLISENEVLKRSIVNQSLCTTTFPDPITTTCMSPPTGLITQQKKSEEKRDNETFSINSTADETMTSITTGDDGNCNEGIEEITTATMRVDGFSDHSPMIQCWLSKMLHEPEIESQNISEFLEISNIM